MATGTTKQKIRLFCVGSTSSKVRSSPLLPNHKDLGRLSSRLIALLPLPVRARGKRRQFEVDYFGNAPSLPKPPSCSALLRRRKTAPPSKSCLARPHKDLIKRYRKTPIYCRLFKNIALVPVLCRKQLWKASDILLGILYNAVSKIRDRSSAVFLRYTATK